MTRVTRTIHDFTLNLCIQYSRPIALSKVLLQFRCLLMYTAMVTDTDHRTSQINFYNTSSALCSSTVAFLLTKTIHTQYTICTMAHHNMMSLQLSTCLICHYMHTSNTLLSSSQYHSITLWKHLSVYFLFREGLA